MTMPSIKLSNAQEKSRAQSMPNTGRPSKDCHECRKRRVKCDLERPECQRCMRIGKPCPGYRDETSLLFKNENIVSLSDPAASRDRRRPRREDSARQYESEPSTPAVSSGSQTPEVSPPAIANDSTLRLLHELLLGRDDWSNLQNVLPNSWGFYAVPLVLSAMSFDHGIKRQWAYASFIPRLLPKTSELGNSPLMLCCEALGLALFTNKLGFNEVERRRDQVYGQALIATNSLVGNDHHCLRDDVSAGVWILSLYEIVTGAQKPSPASSAMTWAIHVQGLTQLLWLRGFHQLDTDTGREIFWTIAMSIQVSSLMAGERYPAFIDEWVASFETIYPTTDRIHVELSNFASRAAALSYDMRQRQECVSTNIGSLTVSDVLRSVREMSATLDDAMQTYAAGRVSLPRCIYITNQYRAYMMRMLHFALDLMMAVDDLQHLKIMNKDGDGNVSWLTGLLKELVDEVLGTTSLLLDTDGSLADTQLATKQRSRDFDRPLSWMDFLGSLWPLRIVMSRKEMLCENQLQLVDQFLQRLNTTYCIRQAVA